MSAVMKISEERLMKVLLAPIISEKATFIAEKYEQVIFRVLKNATKPGNQRRRSKTCSRLKLSLCRC